MQTMTQLERFRAFVAREPMDRVIRHAGFTADLLRRLKEHLGGREPGTYFGIDGGRHVGLKPPAGHTNPDFSRYYPDLKDKSQINGMGVLREKGDFYHFTHIVSPLRNATTLKEIEEFPIETREGWSDTHMRAEVETAHREGAYVIGGIASLYEDAWHIRGIEEFLVDLITQPEFAESILDRLTERNVRCAEAVARAGADMLYSGDDIATQRGMVYHPDTWRKFIKSRWAKVYAAARAIKPDIQIWYHSDGDIESVIPELIEIGLTILNPMQPECMNIERIFRTYGDKVLFDGTMGTQSTFPFGTSDEMRRTVKERIELFGTTAMLAPTHVLEPEVPIENIVAFFEACDTYGRWDT